MIYQQIKTGADLEDDMIMVAVEADNTARVRSSFQEPQPGYHPMPDALESAKVWLYREPEFSRVVIFLHDGATWNREWGELSDEAPSPLTTKPFV